MLLRQMLFGAFRPQTTREIKKVTASERSASQIYERDTALVARSRERPSRAQPREPEALVSPMLLEAFRPRSQNPLYWATLNVMVMPGSTR